MVGIDVVDAHIKESVPGSYAVGCSPEADGFAHIMSASYHSLHFGFLGIDESALAVPDAIAAEIHAEHSHTLQLARCVGGIDVAIEKYVVGIFVEIGRRWFVLPGNHYAASIAVASGIEHIGVLFEKFHQSFHISLGVVRLYFHHQLQAGVGVGIGFAAVHLIDVDDRVEVETLESEVGAQVLEVVTHEEFAVLVEHIALYGINVLRISLIERHGAHIVVVRMQ